MSPFVDREGEVVSPLDLSDYAAVGPAETVAQILRRMRQEQLGVIRCLTGRYPRDVYNLPPDPEAIPQTKEGA